MRGILIQGWKRQGAIGLLGLMAVLVLNRSGLDVWASSQFYDMVSSSFPLRDQYLYSGVLHAGLKNLSVLVWLALLLTCLCVGLSNRFGLAMPFAFSPSLQSGLRFILVSSFLCASVVAWLKSQSAHSCPWDLTSFGGPYDFFYLGTSLTDLTFDFGPGKCFPSGHASVGWMWIGLLFISGASRPLRVLQWLIVGLALLVSVTQVVRGAHFPSHVLMTAVICWVIAALAYHAYPWVFKLRSQVS